MIKVNLIPAHRQRAQRVASHIRGWSWGCCVYGAVLVVVSLVVRVGWSEGRSHLQGSLDDYTQRIERSTADITRLRADLSQLASEVQAATAVGSQPDWSILMALLTQTLDEKIVLRSCKLESSPAGVTGRGQAPGRSRRTSRQEEPLPPSGLWLLLTGYGRDQPAVTRFVLRLEEEEIFGEVKLLDTQREPFLTEQAVAFRVGCALNTEMDTSDPTP